jgi:RimJ/RimL family protein N-acetyltransferase
MSFPDDIVDPYATIVGERVILSDITPEDFPRVHAWLNDLPTLRSAGVPIRPTTFDTFTRRYEQGMAGMREDQVWFLVSDRVTSTPVGFTLLRDIEQVHQRCEFAITIGAAAQRGRGYGTEATRLTLDYAFDVLDLHTVLLTVASYNLGGIRAYEKAGFREIGRQRETWALGNRLWDTVYMECITTAHQGESQPT